MEPANPHTRMQPAKPHTRMQPEYAFAAKSVFRLPKRVQSDPAFPPPGPRHPIHVLRCCDLTCCSLWSSAFCRSSTVLCDHSRSASRLHDKQKSVWDPPQKPNLENTAKPITTCLGLLHGGGSCLLDLHPARSMYPQVMGVHHILPVHSCLQLVDFILPPPPTALLPSSRLFLRRQSAPFGLVHLWRLDLNFLLLVLINAVQ
jgi:hypothetical protein